MTDRFEEISSEVRQVAWLMAGSALAPLIVFAMFQRLRLEPATAKTLFAILAVLIALAIAGLMRTITSHIPRETKTSETAGVRGLSLAAEAMSGALFLGLAGQMFAIGYDALAFVLGISGGLFLLTLIAPALKQYSGDTLLDIIASRFESRAVRHLAAVVIVVALMALVAAELIAVANAGSFLLGIGRHQALLVGSGVVLLAVLLSQTARPAGLSAAAYMLVLGGFLAPIVWLAWTRHGLPVPHAGVGQAVSELTRLETDLIVKKLADARSLIPATLPFQTYDIWNFAGLTVLLGCGVAVFPHLVARVLPAKTPGEARRASARGLLFATLFLMSVPVLAIYGKLLVLSDLNKPIAVAAPASWMAEASAAGLVKICGQSLTDGASLVEACKKMPGSKGQLRVQDLEIRADDVALSLPLIGAMPGLVACVFAAAALLAGIVTSAALLRTVQSAIPAIGPDNTVAGGRLTDALALSLTACAGIAAAAAIAANTTAGLITLVSASATLLAATVFPVVVIGLLWRGATAPGAIAGLVAGFTLALFAVTASALLPVAVQVFLAGLGGQPPPSAVKALQGLQQTWATATDPAVKAAAWQALETHARAMPLWFGLKPIAAGIVALPVAATALAVVSLVTRRHEAV